MIDSKKYITKQNIIRVAFAIIAVLIVYICYDNFIFRLKNTSPSLNTMPDSAREIRFHFSQPIASVSEAAVNDNQVDTEVKGKTIIVSLIEPLESGAVYNVVLSDIKSKWLDGRISSINKSFTPEYVEFNKLSDEEKQAQIAKSNSGQVDDPFIANSAFPIFNQRWQIDATVVTEHREAFLNVKFFEEIPDYDNNGAVKRVSNDTAEKYRLEVLEEIKKRKGNPDTYDIFFDNPYLSKKYSPEGEEDAH